MKELVAQLKTVSPVWTAGIERSNNVPREIGLAGSLRWWYEVLVRGLGGYACDPTDEDRCSFDDDGYKADGIEGGLRTVCPACQMFGCGGWASKFRLLATDAKGQANFSLDSKEVLFQLHFLPTKDWLSAEQWLLGQVLLLIDHYGALGARTTLKPPKFPDYGQVRLTKNIPFPNLERREIEAWLRGLITADLKRKQANQSAEIPRLEFFFFNTAKWLDTKQMNQVVQTDRTGFMAGKRGISKKIFSSQPANRFWGYTTDQRMLNNVLKTLEQMGIGDVKTGKEVLNAL